MKTKKGILRLIAVLGLLVLLAVPGYAAAVDPPSTVSIDPVLTQVAADVNFEVKINIDSVTNFDAAQYDISYDRLVIEMTSVTAGEITTGTGPVAIPVDLYGLVPAGTQGTVRVINNVDGIVPGVTGSGYLAVIHFHALPGTAGQDSNITLSNGLLGNKDAEPITVSAWNGASVTIVNTLTAIFTASRIEVITDQLITFTDQTSGGTETYSYDWDFGDLSTPSTLQNPTHSYSAVGTYTVTLTVNDGIVSDEYTLDITVYPAITRSAEANLDKVVKGGTVSFTGTAGGSKPGTTFDYDWDFGDGTIGTGATPTHVYTTSGQRTVIMTVTDDLGNSAVAATLTVKVYARGDVNEDFSVNSFDITEIELIIMEDSDFGLTPWADANADLAWNALDITKIELIIIAGP
jgi:PKD repeat protein